MKYQAEEKRMWVEDWRGSGKSVWSYAKANGLNPQTFIKWTKAAEEAPVCFVEVTTAAQDSMSETAEILIEKGAVKIHIPVGVGGLSALPVLEWLGRVL